MTTGYKERVRISRAPFPDQQFRIRSSFDIYCLSNFLQYLAWYCLSNTLPF